MPGPCALHGETDKMADSGDQRRLYATNRAAFATIRGPAPGGECHNVEIVEGDLVVMFHPGSHLYPLSARAARSSGTVRSMLRAAPLLAGLACSGAMAAPSTFGPVIGSALLCRSHLDNAYFHAYLTQAFGPPYKREGGAFWFRGDATLWGAKVEEVMVSDDSNQLVFVAAIVDSKPEEFEKSVRAESGTAFKAVDASRYPLRKSNPGSTIAYARDKSKIYCAKFKPQPPGR